jgi:4-hydroxybenzoyl-CoA reductase subunit beta
VFNVATLENFVLRRAHSLSEAAAMLAEPGARLLAGGTDLIPNLRYGLERPQTLVELGGIAGLDEIREDGAQLVIGAGVTLANLARDARLREAYPAIAQAAAAIAAPGHRTVATVGGNLCLDTRCVFYNQSEWWRRSNRYCLKREGEICHVAPHGKHCHAAYSGDLAPAMLVLGAEIAITTPSGSRTVPLTELYRDDGAQHLALGRGEFVAAVRLPGPAPGLRSAYRKARARGAIDFPLAGVAVALELGQGLVRTLRVALTGTNERPLLLAGTDAFSGERVDEPLFAKLAKLVQRQVSPMRTTAVASNYRRQVAVVLAQRLVRELAY